MEKNNEKKEKKKKTKGKDKYDQELPLALAISGLPGSDLAHFVKSLSWSSKCWGLQQVTDRDCAIIKHIETYIYFIHNCTNGYQFGTICKEKGIDVSLALPVGILHHIGTYLEPLDCLNLICANKKLHQVYSDLTLWQCFCIQLGLDQGSNAPLTTSDYKRLIFTERWSYNFQHIEPIIKKHKVTMQTNNWEFSVVEFDTFQRNVAYDQLSVLVFNMAEFDRVLTEPDGTEITYMDKYKDILRNLSTRPHGPITKKQYKRATGRRNGLGAREDFYQPVHRPMVAMFFIGELKLKERIQNEGLTLGFVHDIYFEDMNTETNINYFELFKFELTFELPRPHVVFYTYKEGEISVSVLFNSAKDAILRSLIADYGLL